MEENPQSFKRPITLLMTGLLFCLGPLFGMAGTLLGMLRAFKTLGGTPNADSEALASDVNVAMVSTLIGWAVTPIGVILVIVSTAWIFKLHKKANAPQMQ